VIIIFFHSWKCLISGLVCWSQFWHCLMKSALIFSKWLFSTVLWGLIMQNAIKKMKLFPEFFINKNFGDSFPIGVKTVFQNIWEFPYDIYVFEGLFVNHQVLLIPPMLHDLHSLWDSLSQRSALSLFRLAIHEILDY
jgi:hypothetical protein